MITITESRDDTRTIPAHSTQLPLAQIRVIVDKLIGRRVTSLPLLPPKTLMLKNAQTPVSLGNILSRGPRGICGFWGMRGGPGLTKKARNLRGTIGKARVLSGIETVRVTVQRGAPAM